MEPNSLTPEQQAALRVDNSDSYKANALPAKYKPGIPNAGVQLLPTKRVRFKETDVEASINTADFDAALHEELVEGKGGSQLATLSVSRLTELAEAKGVKLEKGAKKAEIVAALEAAGVTGE